MADVPYLATEHSPGFLIRDTHLAFARALRSRLQPYGMTPGQWFFMRALWEEEGLSQRELSRRVGTTEPTTASALRVLERDGMIRRERNSTDRRTINIFLTGKGRKLRAELLPNALTVNDLATTGISEAEIARLRDILGRMKANLEADSGE